MRQYTTMKLGKVADAANRSECDAKKVSELGIALDRFLSVTSEISWTLDGANAWDSTFQKDDTAQYKIAHRLKWYIRVRVRDYDGIPYVGLFLMCVPLSPGSFSCHVRYSFTIAKDLRSKACRIGFGELVSHFQSPGGGFGLDKMMKLKSFQDHRAGYINALGCVTVTCKFEVQAPVYANLS